jgi:hypothetical protein
MDNDHIPPVSHGDEAPSPGAQIAVLLQGVRSLADAEWEYAKARLSYSGGVARKAGLFAIIAVCAFASAVVALILGILLIVASYFGPWIATFSVVLVFGITACAFAVMARNTARNLSFSDSDSHVE